MKIRIDYEDMEKGYLSERACLSSESKGRRIEEDKCDIRTAFQRDRDRIIHCKAFRRLKQKTQVFIAPQGDHYRTRLTHTLEVSQIARTIARALRLNEDLTEAIALGHDLGHTPFGHSGEMILNKICAKGFRHNEQSLRIVDLLEKKGKGLNLSWEVRDGILNHQTCSKPGTLEGGVVRLSDKIAYLNHDIDDAIRGRVLSQEQLPKQCMDVLGSSTGERIDAMIHDIITQSYNKDEINMSESFHQAMAQLKKFMFTHVYIGSNAKEQEEKAKDLIKSLFYYYIEHSEVLPDEQKRLMDQGEEIESVVCDYIAGMTDNFAMKEYCRLFLPLAWDIY